MHLIDSLITWFWPVWLMFKFPAINLCMPIHSINSRITDQGLVRFLWWGRCRIFMAWMRRAWFCSYQVSWDVSHPSPQNIGLSTYMVQVFRRNNGHQSAMNDFYLGGAMVIFKEREYHRLQTVCIAKPSHFFLFAVNTDQAREPVNWSRHLFCSASFQLLWLAVTKGILPGWQHEKQLKNGLTKGETINTCTRQVGRWQQP